MKRKKIEIEVTLKELRKLIVEFEKEYSLAYEKYDTLNERRFNEGKMYGFHSAISKLKELELNIKKQWNIK